MISRSLSVAATHRDWVLGPNALVWMRADRATISAAYDGARKGFGASQGAGGAQPTLANDAAFNNRKVLTFDGSSDFFSCGSPTKPAALTLIIVASKVNVATISKTLCAANQASGSSVGCWASVGCEVAGELTFAFSNGVSSRSAHRTTSSGIANNTPFVLSVTYSGSGTTFSNVRINGTAQSLTVVASSSSSIGGAAQPFSIGRTGGFNGEYWDGKVAATWIASAAYTVAQLNRAEKLLGAYYGITVA